MYVPASFRESDPVRLHEFIEQYGFGLLTSNGPHGLVASHLPLLLDSTRGPLGTLLGHLRLQTSNLSIMAVKHWLSFRGPHAYISPTWYETPNTVPTWNYVAVHAYGILKRIEDADEVMRMLQLLVQKYEGMRPIPWRLIRKRRFTEIWWRESSVLRSKSHVWRGNGNSTRTIRQSAGGVSSRPLKAAGSYDQLEVARLMELSLERTSATS